MRSYYPFLPRFPHRLNAWKRLDVPVDLSSSGGHRIQFPGLRMAPESLYSRHYLFLSLPHLASKYVSRRFPEDEMAAADSGQNPAELDGDVGGRPERVAADRDVPRDVPVKSDRGGGDRERGHPELPGNGSGALLRDGLLDPGQRV